MQRQTVKRAIENMRYLGNQAWEWQCGRFDFYVEYDNEVDDWVLEQFVSSEQDANLAHVDEEICESLEDALLFSLEAGA